MGEYALPGFGIFGIELVDQRIVPGQTVPIVIFHVGRICCVVESLLDHANLGQLVAGTS